MSNKINRVAIIEEVSRKMGISLAKADTAVNTVLGVITDALANGNNVELRGLGSFTVKQFGESKGRNPQTGETITIPPQRRVKFKASDSIHRALNG